MPGCTWNNSLFTHLFGPGAMAVQLSQAQRYAILLAMQHQVRPPLDAISRLPVFAKRGCQPPTTVLESGEPSPNCNSCYRCCTMSFCGARAARHAGEPSWQTDTYKARLPQPLTATVYLPARPRARRSVPGGWSRAVREPPPGRPTPPGHAAARSARRPSGRHPGEAGCPRSPKPRVPPGRRRRGTFPPSCSVPRYEI